MPQPVMRVQAVQPLPPQRLRCPLVLANQLVAVRATSYYGAAKLDVNAVASVSYAGSP